MQLSDPSDSTINYIKCTEQWIQGDVSSDNVAEPFGKRSSNNIPPNNEPDLTRDLKQYIDTLRKGEIFLCRVAKSAKTGSRCTPFSADTLNSTQNYDILTDNLTQGEASSRIAVESLREIGAWNRKTGHNESKSLIWNAPEQQIILPRTSRSSATKRGESFIREAPQVDKVIIDAELLQQQQEREVTTPIRMNKKRH